MAATFTAEKPEHAEAIERVLARAFGPGRYAKTSERVRERGAVPELVARFRDEARALGRLRHPNLVVVHAVGDFNGVPYFTMDFVEGESLADLLTRSVRLPLPRCLAILQDVCAGVDHAHRHGVVHRDLTPGNVLLDREGRALVTDFGLARDQQASARLTQTGVVMGTPAYMAPEQAHGDHARVGPATDVHAIGAILHECLVGQPPFGNGSTAEVIVRVMHDDPASIRSIDRRIPRDVESVVAKALAKRPEGRYPTVHALANDLARCARGEPVLARPITVAQRGRRWLRRHPLLGAATAGIVVGAVFLGFLRDDRSVAELIALGRQQVADGEPRAAAAAWRRALPRAGNEEKARLRDAARAAMEQADTLDARVDLGVVAVIADRDVPLGAVEPAVLGALLAPVRLSYRASADDTTWLGPSSLELLELVRHRCNLALAGDASGVAADVARELLPQLQMLASRGFPAPGTTTWTRTSVGGIRSRAEAALAAAAAEPDRAREFVLLAWRLLRTRHPVLDGGFLSVVPMDPEAAPPVHSMCDLARRVHGRLAALDPQEAGESRGGITVSLRGPQVPVGLRFLVVVRFRRIGADAEPDTASDDGHDDDHGLLFGTRVTERFLRVAAGTYELQWRRDTSVGGEGDDLERFEVDTGDLPREVSIGSETVVLPLPVRRVELVELKQPKQRAAIDLREQRFVLRSVAGAVRYRVRLGRWESDGRSSYLSGLGAFEVQGLEFTLTLPQAKDAAMRLAVGETCFVHVEAFDERDRRIGTTRTGNDARPTFVVARALGGAR